MPNMAWMHAYPQVLSSYWVANYGTIRSLLITRLTQELHAYFGVTVKSLTLSKTQSPQRPRSSTDIDSLNGLTKLVPLSGVPHLRLGTLRPYRASTVDTVDMYVYSITFKYPRSSPILIN